MAEQKPNYDVTLSQATMEKIMSYKRAILSKKIKPGGFLKALVDTSAVPLERMSTEQFLQSLLSTKKPKFYAKRELKCDGTDWNRTELQILGDIGVVMAVEIYDNGVWSHSDKNFQTHVPPLKGELLFIPGTLLQGQAMKGVVPPDYEEVVTGATIDQEKYNQLVDRRLTPLLYYANNKAKEEGLNALVTLPGIGCGVFAGKFKGKMGEYLKKALRYIMENEAGNLDNVCCVYYDPYNECENENGTKYRVRPSRFNPGRSQLSHPVKYQEAGDDFSRCKLFKVVAWDHVSFPGNDYYEGRRSTDDGVSAAATNSMEIITGVAGRYVKGKYLPPAGKSKWKEVVSENNVTLKASGNVKVLTLDKRLVDLRECDEARGENSRKRKISDSSEDTV